MGHLLRELWRHGVRHQRQWRMLLRGKLLGWMLRRHLGLRELVLRMACAILYNGLIGNKLLGLEVVLGSKSSCLIGGEVWLSIGVVIPSTISIAGTVATSIASVLRTYAITLVWSIVISSIVVSIPTAAIITPSRGIPIPTVIVTTSAAPWTTWKVKKTIFNSSQLPFKPAWYLIQPRNKRRKKSNCLLRHRFCVSPIRFTSSFFCHLEELWVNCLVGLAQNRDEVPGLPHVVGSEEGIGCARLLATSRSANAVDIVLRVVRVVIVDDKFHVFHICKTLQCGRKKGNTLRVPEPTQQPDKKKS